MKRYMNSHFAAAALFFFILLACVVAAAIELWPEHHIGTDLSVHARRGFMIDIIVDSEVGGTIEAEGPKFFGFISDEGGLFWGSPEDEIPPDIQWEEYYHMRSYGISSTMSVEIMTGNFTLFIDSEKPVSVYLYPTSEHIWRIVFLTIVVWIMINFAGALLLALLYSI